MDIKHTEEFDLAYRFVTETNLNIFLTGKAGTGKTTFLKYLRENSFKKMVVAAPTGVAAINAGGVTLHSLFQLPLAPFVPRKSDEDDTNNTVDKHSLLSQIRFNKDKINLFRSLELLVIDEASMVACDKIDAIDTILRSVRRRYRIPFGGVQVLFIGDMHQLQPVVPNSEWEILKAFYPSRFFFDSYVLRENVPVMIELREIFRQKDVDFIEVLNAVRNNSLTHENLTRLNSRMQRGFQPADKDDYITLTTHNAQADRINEIQLRKLNTYSRIYHAEINEDFAQNLYPAEEKLELKIGAYVMFIRNDTQEKRYFNGKTGTVTELDEDFIKVQCKGEDSPVIVKKFEWENVSYKLNRETREVETNKLGSFVQYPLRLAWAITIHKSQGLTFDKVIIDAENAFAGGQVYVALSRCRTLDGLILTSSINRRFLGTHQELQEWTEKNNDADNLPGRFNESRAKFVRQELESIFTWNNWEYGLHVLKEIIEEEKENLPQACFAWISELADKQKELNKTAEKFKESIEKYCNQNPLVEQNEALQERIKAAANYFSTELQQWKEKFSEHPCSVDTKKSARKIDTALSEINGTIHEMLHKFNYCRNGFTLTEYLQNGKKLMAPVKTMETSYAQDKIRGMNSDELQHAELYERLAEMRKRISDAENIPLYVVFSNNTIKNVCTYLPRNHNTLLMIHGLGKRKVGMYGNEVLEIVNEYCREMNIEEEKEMTSVKISKSSGKKKASATIEESVRLFRTGKTIEQIASERSLVAGTIESHLARAIRNNMMQIEECMSMEEARSIAAYFPEQPGLISLASIKEKAPAEISYGKLRMVLEWLCRNEVK